MSITLEIDIADDLIDVPRRIHAHGLAAGAAQLTVSTTYPDGSVWQSRADYHITADGTFNPEIACPQSGDWQEAGSMTPVEALRQVTPPHNPALTDSVLPRRITFRIEDARGAVAEAVLIQRFLAPGVTRRETREPSGVLFLPAAPGPHPLVIVLNGSGGGTPEQKAALLAAQGYIGFALAYFKAPGRPAHISNTPLEYFQQAIDWVAREVPIRANFVAVMGHSRGGELALLLAATFPERIAAVIGYVPSAVIHGTLRAGAPDEPRDATAWRWRGEPLRNIWQDNPYADWHAFDHPPQPDAPIRQAPAFINVERDAQRLADARIPVERIRGPVMLISGTDDGFWPSTAWCERIVADLKESRWPVIHLCHEGAGHAIGFPWVPTTNIANVHPVAGVRIDGGGTPSANARANRESWPQVLTFLTAAVAAHEGKA
ncbi:acyl-CoA thioester hydrolase/BAAT C-terminal domain-containing protein [Erwinia oleae]|uniref:acyl-CoA thioester hydrolase/BAAT C-terminal domain-containing protein n=1 Tax=Erwinia oleae TaxID=796334 RepID=UPI000550E40F|nr:acyl-CoA thioester hydrolase/BAAT C-terminal domain-containing protein [Erwinia oleae]